MGCPGGMSTIRCTRNSIYARFSGQFFFTFSQKKIVTGKIDRCAVFGCNYDHLFREEYILKFSFCPKSARKNWASASSSSETQGQIVGARESLNGRKNMARRKVKDGEKSPWGQCLTRPVPNGRCCSGFWFVAENLCFSGTNQKPERRRPFGTGLVRHCPQGLFYPSFTFLRAIFSRPFRLSLAPTLCPWVSEDGIFPEKVKSWRYIIFWLNFTLGSTFIFLFV